MARMLNLTNVLEEIIDAFNNSPLAEQDFISHVHEFVLHVFLELRDKLNTVRIEFSKQRRGNVTPVGENLAKHFLCEFGDDRPVPVIDITGSKAESYDFTLVVYGKMEFEAEKPTCTALTLPGKTIKYFV